MYFEKITHCGQLLREFSFPLSGVILTVIKAEKRVMAMLFESSRCLVLSLTIPSVQIMFQKRPILFHFEGMSRTVSGEEKMESHNNFVYYFHFGLNHRP